MAKRGILEEDKYDLDADRISDNLWNDSRGKIIDRDSFNLYYDDYMAEDGRTTRKQKGRIREQTFQMLLKKHKDDVVDEHLFKKAKGKDLDKDRKTTAKEIVTTKEEYKKKGASKVDLKGYDTKKKLPSEIYKYSTWVYDKELKRDVNVYSRRTILKRPDGSRKVVYRDRKGRFTRRKYK